MFKPDELFDLTQTEHSAVFEGCQYAWEALAKIASYLAAHLHPQLPNRCEGTAYIGERVFIGEGTVLEDGVMIKGPAIIGKNCQIRHNAYIRQNVIIGDDCVVGNATRSQEFDSVQPRPRAAFQLRGRFHPGPQSPSGRGRQDLPISRSFPATSCVEMDGQPFDTGLRKFGALLGDGCEIGCNAVLSPGSIIGRGSVIYPNVTWRGILPDEMIVKKCGPGGGRALRGRAG